jgi:hypothetical protein
VALTIPWVGVCAFLWIFRVVTVEFPLPGEVMRMVSPAELSGVTAVNVLLLVGLILEGRKAVTSPRDLRRAHLVTVAMAIGLIIALQVHVSMAATPLGPMP